MGLPVVPAATHNAELTQEHKDALADKLRLLVETVPALRILHTTSVIGWRLYHTAQALAEAELHRHVTADEMSGVSQVFADSAAFTAMAPFDTNEVLGALQQQTLPLLERLRGVAEASRGVAGPVVTGLPFMCPPDKTISRDRVSIVSSSNLQALRFIAGVVVQGTPPETAVQHWHDGQHIVDRPALRVLEPAVWRTALSRSNNCFKTLLEDAVKSAGGTDLLVIGPLALPGKQRLHVLKQLHRTLRYFQQQTKCAVLLLLAHDWKLMYTGSEDMQRKLEEACDVRELTVNESAGGTQLDIIFGPGWATLSIPKLKPE